MTTMMHWSPFTPEFHLHHHHVEDLFPRFFAVPVPTGTRPGVTSSGRTGHTSARVC
jgi:hypothetical protein